MVVASAFFFKYVLERNLALGLAMDFPLPHFVGGGGGGGIAVTEDKPRGIRPLVCTNRVGGQREERLDRGLIVVRRRKRIPLQRLPIALSARGKGHCGLCGGAARRRGAHRNGVDIHCLQRMRIIEEGMDYRYLPFPSTPPPFPSLHNSGGTVPVTTAIKLQCCPDVQCERRTLNHTTQSRPRTICRPRASKTN